MVRNGFLPISSAIILLGVYLHYKVKTLISLEKKVYAMESDTDDISTSRRSLSMQSSDGNENSIDAYDDDDIQKMQATLRSRPTQRQGSARRSVLEDVALVEEEKSESSTRITSVKDIGREYTEVDVIEAI
jgi:hypothetical protein